MLLWLFVMIAIVYGGYRFFRKSNSSAGTNPSSALDILNERYARGEIDSDTYKRIKEELK